jgi:hypothetical protein
MMRRSQSAMSFALGLLGNVLLTMSVAATPLAPEICENLKSEVASLEQGGLRATIARGPDAAKSTLTPEQFGLVRRLIELDAQLKFRCPSDRAAALLKNVAPEDNPDAPGYSSETEVGGPTVPVQPKAKANPSRAARPKVEGPVASAPTGDATPVTPKPTPRAKSVVNPVAKSDDAYRPPASGDPNGTPLQAQQPVKSPVKTIPQ